MDTRTGVHLAQAVLEAQVVPEAQVVLEDQGDRKVQMPDSLYL